METDIPQNRWQFLSPDLRAALVVAVAVIGLEFASDLIPLVGFLVTIPVAVVVYIFQGVLVARFTRADPRRVGLSAGGVLRLGLRSALWTGALLSPLVAVVDMALLTPLTVGLALAAIPAVIASSLVDLLLNLAFTGLGAWWLARSDGNLSFGKTCLGAAIILLLAWIIVAILSVAAILLLLRILPPNLSGF